MEDRGTESLRRFEDQRITSRRWAEDQHTAARRQRRQLPGFGENGWLLNEYE